VSGRRGLVVLGSLGAAAALAWTAVGGLTVAAGQERQVTIQRSSSGSYRPSFSKPIFILALGGDSGSPRYGRPGRVDRSRMDSIHVIAINPTQKRATIIGIPRDSYVPIPGRGQNKINAAGTGGPELVERTVSELSGGRLRFDYWVVGSFEALEDMVNELGGVPVTVEPGLKGTLQDAASRARGIRPGRQVLNGRQALAYARDRHDYGTGDFARSDHQGDIMIGALEKARADSAANPGRTLEYLRSVFRHTKLDIPLVEAFKLGLLLLQIDPANVRNIVLPGTTGTTPAGSSVLLGPEAARILADVADDALVGG
jgi:LCP family protein required for cell wall assembly